VDVTLAPFREEEAGGAKPPSLSSKDPPTGASDFFIGSPENGGTCRALELANDPGAPGP
jgi:hypothetical protein